MKNKKQLIALLICAVMFISLTACNNSQSPETKTPTTESETPSTSEKEPSKASSSDTEQEEITLSVAWWGGDTRNTRVAKTLDMYSTLHPNIKFSTAAHLS